MHKAINKFILLMLIAITAVSANIAANAAEMGCWSVFNIRKSAGSSADINGNEISIETGEATSANPESVQCEYQLAVSKQYTVGFAFKSVENGELSIGITDGTNRAYINFMQNGISYNKTGGMGSLSFAMGTGWHNIRLVKHRSNITIYDNDSVIGKIEQQTISKTPAIAFNFENRAKGTKKIVVKDFSYEEVIQKYDSIKPVEKTEAFCDEFTSDCSGWTLTNGYNEDYYLEDGSLVFEVEHGNEVVMQKPVGISDKFAVEVRMRMERMGAGQGWQIRWGNARTYLTIYEGFILYLNNSSFTQLRSGYNPYDWHVWKYEIDGKNAKLYIDGEMLLDTFELSSFSESIPNLWLWAAGGDNGSKIRYDYIKYTPEIYDIEIKNPISGSQFPKGQNIDFCAETDLSDVPYVDYYVNDIRVGQGYAPDYKFTYTANKQGKYEVTAMYKDKSGARVNFEVADSVVGKLDVPEYIAAGEDCVVSTQVLDFGGNITDFRYYCDGRYIASGSGENFTANLGKLPAGVHRIYAEAVTSGENAMYIKAQTVRVVPKLGGGFSDSYNISYDAANANGEIRIADGKYLFDVKHIGGKLAYMTASGEKQTDSADGKYSFRVDNGIADIYYNGKLYCEYIMPAIKESFSSQSGTGINNITCSLDDISPVLYTAKLQNGEYRELKDMSQNYVLDFDLKSGDDINITLTDSGYVLNLETDGNDIYCEDGMSQLSSDEVSYTKTKIADRSGIADANYRAVVCRGMMQLFANNAYLGSARLKPVGKTAGIRFTATAADGTLSIRENKSVYKYSEDFSDGNTNCWQFVSANYYNDGGLVVSSTADSKMLLNTSANNPYLKAKVNVSQCSGGFWFVFRNSTEEWYDKIGYNAVSKKWELVHRYGTDKVITSAAGELDLNRDVVMELVCDDENVTLLCNGTAVIGGAVGQTNHGKTGFMLNNAVAKIYSVDYTGDSKVSEGITDFTLPYAYTNDFLKLKNGNILMMSDSNKTYESSDNGAAWNLKTTHDTHYQANFIRLNSGKILTLVRQESGGGYEVSAYLSENDGKSFSGPYLVQQAKICGSMNNKLYQSPTTGRIFYATTEKDSSDGAEILEDSSYACVYYSDDEGETWTKSETDMTTEATGLNLQEPKTVDLPDGTVRTYFRSDLGFLYYADSKDGGKTFGEFKRSNFISVQHAFNIERDPYNTDTYYMIWEYDNTNENPVRQYPRTRAALAVSYDGCKTWNYVMDLYEIDSKERVENAQVGHMNHAVRVFEDYIFVSSAQSEPQNENTTVAWRNRGCRIDKSMIKALPRFTQLRMHNERTLNAAETKLTQRSLYADNKGGFLVNGRYDYRKDTPQGYVPADLLAEYAGAEAILADAEVSSGMNKKILTISMGDNLFKMVEGDKYCISDGGEYTGELPMTVINGTAYIPLETASKAYGKSYFKIDNAEAVTDLDELTDGDKKLIFNFFNNI